MRFDHLVLSLTAALWLTGCVSVAAKKQALDARREKEAAAGRAFHAAAQHGRSLAAQDPALLKSFEELSFAHLLYKFVSPYAGARRLLDFKDRHPEHPLLGDLMPEAGDAAFLEIQDDDAFRTGQFNNSFDPALYVPVFRQALLQALQAPAGGGEEQLRLGRALALGAQLSPRYAGVYPNQLSTELAAAMRSFLAEHPQGPIAERLRMHLLWDERNGAWAARRSQIDRDLAELKGLTHDELLRLELKEALDAPVARPEKGFWLSLLVPGLGQVASGDLQGGLLLGGLTASAWAWMAGKLAAAQSAPDFDSRRIYEGDAALAGGLALLGHLFTAFNAAEQAHFVNIVFEWDILSKDRLSP